MEFEVRLRASGHASKLNNRLEASNVIARLKKQNITQYKLLPNADNPKRIKFKYDGRKTKGQSVESSKEQYNTLSEREGGTFVSMDQILMTDMLENNERLVAKGDKPKKPGEMYAHIPIHPRTRAQVNNPAQPNGSVLYRTVSQKHGIPQGDWIVFLRDWLLKKHESNGTTISPDNDNPAQNVINPDLVREQLGITEDVSTTPTDDIDLEAKDRLAPTINIDPELLKEEEQDEDTMPDTPTLPSKYNIPSQSTNNIHWNNPRKNWR